MQQDTISPKKKLKSEIIDFFRTAFYALFFVLFIRTIAYEPFNIPSGSMIPTLLVGDYLFVSKFAYGYSGHSLPLINIPVKGRLFFSPPERGDVVVFKLPTNTSIDYVKRLIGLPGDEIQMKNGTLYINGEAVKRERIEDYIEDKGYGVKTIYAQYIEILPNGKSHHILERSDDDMLDNTPVYKVPENHYFFMGDNRDNSEDSRVLSKVGYVPEENLVGRADLLFFSISNDSSLWQFWKWFDSVRIERLFTKIF
ncbi:MAG: signal peptidase I [Alphaproteobacteria bacterium]|nr:signal peptidase I [Alphaproteobacteria bacterium]